MFHVVAEVLSSDFPLLLRAPGGRFGFVVRCFIHTVRALSSSCTHPTGPEPGRRVFPGSRGIPGFGTSYCLHSGAGFREILGWVVAYPRDGFLRALFQVIHLMLC